MKRQTLGFDYADAPMRTGFEGLDPNVPQVGCYRSKGRNRVPSVIRIWLGHPIDPETGEEMTERGFRWQATRNGAPVDVLNVWPECASDPVSAEEHDRLISLHRTMDPASPFFDARRPIDLNTAPTPF